MSEQATDFAPIHHLEVTVAHHDDNEFYMLGRVMPEAGGGVLSWNAAVVADVTHEVPPAALFAALVDQPCVVGGPATCPTFCITLDACTESGDTITDKEIDVETADTLLDGEFTRRLAVARDELAGHYEYESRRPEGVSSFDWLMRLAATKEADRG